jgi:hypothetical protein
MRVSFAHGLMLTSRLPSNSVCVLVLHETRTLKHKMHICIRHTERMSGRRPCGFGVFTAQSVGDDAQGCCKRDTQVGPRLACHLAHASAFSGPCPPCYFWKRDASSTCNLVTSSGEGLSAMTEICPYSTGGRSVALTRSPKTQIATPPNVSSTWLMSNPLSL